MTTTARATSADLNQTTPASSAGVGRQRDGSNCLICHPSPRVLTDFPCAEPLEFGPTLVPLEGVEEPIPLRVAFERLGLAVSESLRDFSFLGNEVLLFPFVAPVSPRRERWTRGPETNPNVAEKPAVVSGASWPCFSRALQRDFSSLLGDLTVRKSPSASSRSTTNSCDG